jgi:hypothetical protein
MRRLVLTWEGAQKWLSTSSGCLFWLSKLRDSWLWTKKWLAGRGKELVDGWHLADNGWLGVVRSYEMARSKLRMLPEGGKQVRWLAICWEWLLDVVKISKMAGYSWRKADWTKCEYQRWLAISLKWHAGGGKAGNDWLPAENLKLDVQ